MFLDLLDHSIDNDATDHTHMHCSQYNGHCSLCGTLSPLLICVTDVL